MADPIFTLPELGEADPLGYLRQNNRNLIHAVMARRSVLANNLTAPPGTFTRGSAWLVKATATGVWTGQVAGTLAIALYAHTAPEATVASGWFFLPPSAGMSFFVIAGDAPTGNVVHNGTAYVAAERLQLPSQWDVASLSATTGPKKIGAAPRAGTVRRIVLLCDTASTSSSGNEWQFVVSKRTNATPGTPVALFSATVGTFTALAGVGGGAEFVAHKVYVLTPNQNATVLAGDALELTMTKLGTGTTLVNFMAWAEME